MNARIVAGLCMLLVLSLSALIASAREPGVLVLGRVSDDPRAHYERLQPILGYVVARMGDLGVREGRVLMARDAQQMVSYLRQGKVDWVTETSGAALGLAERGQARILLRARRGGFYDYRTVFFARRDSGIAAIADLPGRAVGLQHPMSTSAYLVPAALMLEQGLTLAIQASPLERPPPDFVGYAFARSEANLVTWVHKGLVDAAAFSNQDWDELVEATPAMAADLVVFQTSEPYPRALELVREDLDARLRERLRELLLAAHEDADAALALQAYFGTERFDAIDGATQSALNRLRAGVRRVRAEIE